MHGCIIRLGSPAHLNNLNTQFGNQELYCAVLPPQEVNSCAAQAVKAAEDAAEAASTAAVEAEASGSSNAADATAKAALAARLSSQARAHMAHADIPTAFFW